MEHGTPPVVFGKAAPVGLRARGTFTAASERTATPAVEEPFEFVGSAGEYARIWIVNLMLTIVTLGIYSAWAKVRRLRYFYGNTLLQGHGFDYHADPIRILIGRLIVLGALFVINMLSQISPAFLLLLLPYLVALPWLINQSLAFNAQMTSYRNVRFSFHGSYGGAFFALLLMPMVALASAGTLAPFASRRRVNYLGSRLRFGTARFETSAQLGPLYANLGAALMCFLLVVALSYLGIRLMQVQWPGPGGDTAATNAVLLFLIMMYVSAFLSFQAYRAGVRNIAFCATTLEGGHRLSSSMSRRRYLWIMLSNAVMVICTLGLLWPVAAVRSWRYFVASTTVHAAGTLDNFVALESRKANVAAAEYLDLGGFDFGL